MKKAAGTVGQEIVGIDIPMLIDLLNTAYADEWLAYHQYWIGSKVLVGKMRNAVESELIEHADDEKKHAGMLIDRIIQLGGSPLLSPEEWFERGDCGFSEPVDTSVAAILKQNIEAEQCAIRFYKELIDLVRGRDDVTFEIIEEILKDEVEHEEDLQMIEQDMESGWDGQKVASELVSICKSLVSAKTVTLIRDIKTKIGVQFNTGESLQLVSYDENYPHLMRLRASDGRTLALHPATAYQSLRGFSRPPSMGTLNRWMDDGVAKAVDGARVEPDGFSPAGAPSWLLAMGLI